MYYLYEVYFDGEYSICIKSLFPDVTMEDIEILNNFLQRDIEQFGNIVDVAPISEVEARSFYDLDNIDNWPVL